jgi:hypothetical protein
MLFLQMLALKSNVTSSPGQRVAKFLTRCPNSGAVILKKKERKREK